MRTVALLVLLLAGCDGDFKHWFPTTPELLDDGWSVATPESVGLDSQVLEGVHHALLRPDRYFGALAFLVIKDDRLVFEAYLRRPADRDSLHHLQSVTKSVTSVLYGIGRDQGWMPGLETPVCSILADECTGLEARKQAITFRHLLTMRAGLDFAEVDFSRELWVGQPKDPIRFIFDKPLAESPGEVFRYADCDTQLVGYAMQRLTGRTEDQLAQALLFAPLGIHDTSWDHGAGGETMAAHGLHLRPRDLAKLGALMLDGGRWHGASLVSSAWVAESTSLQTTSDAPRFGYGAGWWVVGEAQAFAAWGHGGQYVLVVPNKRLVLVEVALPDTTLLHGNDLGDFVELTRPLWQ